MNVNDAAKALGLVVYDTALPQEWVDMIKKETGIYPAGHFVWSYDMSKVWGEPAPIDEIGWQICHTMGIKPRVIKES